MQPLILGLPWLKLHKSHGLRESLLNGQNTASVTVYNVYVWPWWTLQWKAQTNYPPWAFPKSTMNSEAFLVKQKPAAYLLTSPMTVPLNSFPVQFPHAAGCILLQPWSRRQWKNMYKKPCSMDISELPPLRHQQGSSSWRRKEAGCSHVLPTGTSTKSLVKYPYLLPLVPSVLEQLCTAHVLMKHDLHSAYNLVHMQETSGSLQHHLQSQWIHGLALWALLCPLQCSSVSLMMCSEIC